MIAPLLSLTARAASAARAHRLLAVLVAIAVTLGGGAAVYAATTTAPFSLTVSPASQTIGSGNAATYVVSLTPNNFSGTVTLTAGSLPKGTAATWTVGGTTTSSSATITVPAGSSGARTATLTVGGGQPSAGTYSLTVTGTSGSSSTSAAASLTVVGQNTATFGLSTNPGTVSPVAGATNPTTTVSITRTNWTGAVTLGPVSGLPSGVTALFGTSATTTTTGASAALTITVPPSTPAGSYALVIPGSAASSGKNTTANSTALTLTVPPSGNFPISGNLATPLTLGIGGTRSLNLLITNPYSTPLTVTNIGVTLTSVKAAAGAVGGCNQTAGTPQSPNFRINALSPSYSVTVPANSTRTLSQLGSGTMPSVTWLDQPWAQNGCLGATLNFSYSASAQY